MGKPIYSMRGAVLRNGGSRLCFGFEVAPCRSDPAEKLLGSIGEDGIEETAATLEPGVRAGAA